MHDFVFHNPTKIVFGKNAIATLGETCAAYGRRVLLLFGGGSIKQNGVFQAVMDQLSDADLSVTALGGVQPNPIASHVREAVQLVKESGIDLVLAVGGGSVIDEAKAIAASASMGRDIWDLVTAGEPIQDALPLVTVLTLAATASEMNSGAVITDEETQLKLSIGGPALYPRVSFLNPAFTVTVPPDQSAYGAVDAISHLVEPYFTHGTPEAPLSLAMSEAVIRTIRKTVSVVLKDPTDYNARATMMWSATVAFNGLIRSGYGSTGFPNHMIEHGISGVFPHVAHGAGLAVVIPAWLRHMLDEKQSLIARFGREILGVTGEDDKAAAIQTIDELKSWFAAIGAPVNLRDLSINGSDIPRIAEKAAGVARYWGLKTYDAHRIADILKLAESA